MGNVKQEISYEQLLILGLTEYEAKVYLELIHHSQIGATTLAKISKVSRGRIYDILDSLIEKGYCKVIPGKKKNYKAIAPEVAIDNVLNEMREAMHLKERTISKTAKNLQKVFDDINEDEPPVEHVQILTSQSAIRERIQQLQYECRSVLRVFIKPPIIMDPNQKNSDERMKDQIKKKLKIKQVYEYNEVGYKEFADSVFEAREKGADFDVRISMKLPLKLVVFDDDHALFTLSRERKSTKNYSMMSVSHTYLTVAMMELFEFYWESAVPLEEFIIKYPIND
jgi:HTH-type transcriptional regulator, sugar sensing transcriptional regulator